MSKALQSNAFPHAYLRIDGTGLSAPSSGGGGTVNCQAGVADFETPEEAPQPDGTIAIASVSFPNVYLRMDGSGIVVSRRQRRRHGELPIRHRAVGEIHSSWPAILVDQLAARRRGRQFSDLPRFLLLEPTNAAPLTAQPAT
jgi:hypothetical protein